MQFQFDEPKALEAVALLLKLSGGRDNVLKVMKYLYYAERQSLEEFGYPITGDNFFALRKGPILSQTLDLINDNHSSLHWHEFVQRSSGKSIDLIKDPGTGQLTDYELNTLTSIWDRYHHLTPDAFSEESHQLPEWIANKPPFNGRRPIDHELLLRILGWGEDEIVNLITEAAS